MALTDYARIIPADLLYNFILPFLLIFAVLFGMVSMLKLFDKKISFVISIVISILVASTPYFATFTVFVSQLGGYTALIAFGIIFILGIGMYATGKTADIYSENMPKWGKLKIIRKQKAELRKELNKAKEKNDKDKMHAVYEQLKRLEEDEDTIMHS